MGEGQEPIGLSKALCKLADGNNLAAMSSVADCDRRRQERSEAVGKRGAVPITKARWPPGR